MYSGIAKACMLIALDNGGINRDRSPEQQGADYALWIARTELPNLPEINSWLEGLSDDDLNLVCCGGQDEPETIAVMQSAPMFLNTLLNDYFDEVC